MKNVVAFFLLTVLAVSCIPGQHNSAPNVSVDSKNPRIYGQRGGEPKQLKNKYEIDGKVNDRAMAIREKFGL